MAWMHGWKPARAARRTTSARRASEVTSSPRVDGSSLYGADSSAPREPRAPSAKSLTARTASIPSRLTRGPAASSPSSQSSSLVASITYTRNGSRPAACSARSTASSGAVVPASWISVRPNAVRCRPARSTRRSMSAAVAAGTARSSSASAVSRRTPVGCPEASRTMRPPGGSGVARGDAGRGEGAGVGEGGVAVHPAQQDGVVRDRGGKRVVRRKALVGPEVLVPTAAQHPGARRERGGGPPHSRHDLVEAGRVVEVHLFEGRAVPDEVAVALGHAGEHVRAGEVDDLGGGASPRRGVRGRHERQNAAVGDGDLEALRSSRNVHDAAGQQPVAARRMGACGARQRDQRHDHHQAQHHATVAARRRRGNGEPVSLAALPGRVPVPENPITRRDLITTTAKAAAVAAAVGPALAQAAPPPARSPRRRLLDERPRRRQAGGRADDRRRVAGGRRGRRRRAGGGRPRRRDRRLRRSARTRRGWSSSTPR